MGLDSTYHFLSCFNPLIMLLTAHTSFALHTLHRFYLCPNKLSGLVWQGRLSSPTQFPLPSTFVRLFSACRHWLIVCSFAAMSVCLFIHCYRRLFIGVFVCSFIRSYLTPFICSFVCAVVAIVILLLVSSFAPLFICCVLSLSVCFGVASYHCLFVRSFISL